MSFSHYPRGGVESPAIRTGLPGLSREKLLRMFRWMVTSREMDEAEIRLQRQQKTFFQISTAGHEAVQAAAGLLLHPGVDWFYPYYRDRTLALALGVTPYEMFLQSMGRRDDPSSGGREMSCHWGSPALHIVNQSSPTGTQYHQAVGTAEVGRIARAMPPCDDRPSHSSRELVFVSGGEGSTSEGEFFEAISSAALLNLPVLFLIEDNKYAISVPVEVQTPGGSISRLLRDFPNLNVSEVNGLDPVASYRVLRSAVKHVRQGRGPALVHAHVIRLRSHSNSDDDSLYKTKEERELEKASDPIRTFEAFLTSERLCAGEELAAISRSVKEQIAEASRQAESRPLPEPESITRHLFSEEDSVFPPRSPQGDGVVSPGVFPGVLPPRSPQGDGGGGGGGVAEGDGGGGGGGVAEGDGGGGGAGLTMVDMVNRVLHEEMDRDPRIVVFGQDIADVSRSEFLDQVKGKGGVFKATWGLQRKYGDLRVFNTPITEAGIVGRALGMAVRGLRPVVEIQFFDYIWPAMLQIRNELAIMRWRSNDSFSAPVVIRVPIGGYVRGGGPFHSQTGESILCHCPGLRVVFPSNARDACGLLRTAIRSSDPVIFLEHKHLYRQNYNRSPMLDPGYVIPFGKARVVRRGDDLTVVTYGALVQKSLLAAEKLSQRGYGIEVIDLRSIQPYDFETVAESVRRTSRVVVASEETAAFGVSAELAARISEELFSELDAPVSRVGSVDCPVAYSPVLEEATLPQVHWLEDAFRAALEF